MSWFERKKDWAEEVLTADDLNAEFDAVAAALNGIAQAKRVSSSESIQMVGAKDVPGASVSITLSRPSLVIVSTNFHLDITTGAGSNKGYAVGYLNVDGSNQAVYPVLGCGQNMRVGQTVGESYVLSLGTGSHTLKLRCEVNTEGPPTGGYCWNAGFSYLILPDPEP